MMKRSLMVPGSLSSALQTMYCSLPGRVANDFPFIAGGKTGAAHAAKSAGFEGGDDACSSRGFRLTGARRSNLRDPS